MGMMKIDYKLVLDLIWSIFLLSVIGILFVGFSIFLGKYELLSVAFVLVLATNVRSFIPQKLRIACESIPVLGEGLEIFNQLETYYVQYRPRSPFYYILYPITSILGFVKGGERAQRELAAYFYLIRWIVLLLVIESADLYLDLSQQFNWFFSFKWLYLELLCLYFLSNFFMIPLSTSSLSLSVSQKRVRLSILSVMTLMMLTGFTYFMSTHGGYYGVVPQNIVLEKRFSTLMPTQGVQTFSFQSKSKETHAVKAVEEQSSTHKKKQTDDLVCASVEVMHSTPI